ncbi:hypothetical protein AGLY_015108 [Aphis glycines]|uniref:Uncharacterized protein n=1 Tax=Aphis glycines TaxID=307491 RepID=A0A6G0T1J5_APHGL|nr:hypothetical protein AGLY_015108 [Aphis glycines]
MQIETSVDLGFWLTTEIFDFYANFFLKCRSNFYDICRKRNNLLFKITSRTCNIHQLFKLAFSVHADTSSPFRIRKATITFTRCKQYIVKQYSFHTSGQKTHIHVNPNSCSNPSLKALKYNNIMTNFSKALKHNNITLKKIDLVSYELTTRRKLFGLHCLKMSTKKRTIYDENRTFNTSFRATKRSTIDFILLSPVAAGSGTLSAASGAASATGASAGLTSSVTAGCSPSAGGAGCASAAEAVAESTGSVAAVAGSVGVATSAAGSDGATVSVVVSVGTSDGSAGVADGSAGFADAAGSPSAGGPPSSPAHEKH